jgi:DNA (cytosine-5)-methyltransferase 1
LWPTPTICGNYNKKGLSKTSGDGLETAVKLWPTPTAGDIGGVGHSKKAGGMNLRTKVFYPTPDANCGSRGSQPKFKAGPSGLLPTYTINQAVRDIERAPGNLNPDWVEWLMGWPIGWSDLKPLKELRWLNISEDPHPEIPRVTTKKENRTNRLKGIGNGQFPHCVFEVWKILTIN